MIRILITGKNSYVGRNIEEWIRNFPDTYSVESISLRDDSWKEQDFSNYDVIVQVVGIAHIKETKVNSELYYKVNRDLVFETAFKAKTEGVRHFILLSSMSVYGVENGLIDENTPLNPKSIYGKSKLEGEKSVSSLESENFRVAVVRPPMIYGKGCKGNYSKLSRLAVKTPIFPKLDNKRSMIYIENLCEFIRLIIKNKSTGLFFPQNKEYICTSEMVKLINELHKKKIYLIKIFNPILKRIKLNTVNKVFGDLVYDEKISNYLEEYNIYSFSESLKRTEVD